MSLYGCSLINRKETNMECKGGKSTNIIEQGFMIVGEDRKEDWAKHLLDIKIYTCQDCKSTFSYKEKKS